MSIRSFDVLAPALRHGEKLAVGAAVLIALAVWLTAPGDGADETGAAIAAHEAAIVEMAAAGVPDAQLPAVVDPLITALEPWGRPNAVEIPDRAAWLHYAPPAIDRRPLNPPAPRLAVSLAHDALRVRATRDGVAIEWAPPPVAGERAGRTLLRAELIGYELRAERGGAPAAPTRHVFGPDERRFVDRDARPEIPCAYQVRALYARGDTGDWRRPRVLGGSVVTLAASRWAGRTVRATAWVGPVRATMPRNVRVDYRSRLASRATLVIWRYWKGAWWRVEVKVRPGDAVGGTISPRALLADPFNRAQRAGHPAFAALEAAPEPGAATIPWRTGLVYLGHARLGGEEVVLLERHAPGPRGLGGVDWGTRLIRVRKSRGQTPPE